MTIKTQQSCTATNNQSQLVRRTDIMTDHNPIIVFDHVTKQYPRAKRGSGSAGNGPAYAVNDVSLTINKGEIFGIIGHSGAGKSTLVRMINALEKPTSGSVRVLGTEVSALSEAKLRPIRRDIGMIFQQFNLFSSKTVTQNVAYPMQLDHWRKDFQERRVGELLDFVGLRDHADKYPSQLSGGQKQRVGIARALATSPKILLADEATSALDPQTTNEVLTLLKQVNRHFGVTIVLITHQMEVVQRFADRIAVMSDGRVIESGDAYNVFASPRHDVTKRFVGAALHGLPEPERIETLHEQWQGRIVTVLVRQKPIDTGDARASSASGQNISELIAKHRIASSLLYGGIDTVKGSAVGAITYEFSGPQQEVDDFLHELAQQSDIADFGTAAEPVPYEEAVALAETRTMIGVDAAADVAAGAAVDTRLNAEQE